MKWLETCKIPLLTALLLFISFTNLLECRYLNNLAPSHLSHYCLIDLGPTQLPERCLKRHCWPMTLAPRINNNGTVIGNRGNEAFVWNKYRGFTTYSHKYMPTHFVAINNHDIIVGRVELDSDCTEWFLWSENQSLRELRAPFIDFECLNPSTIYLREINDKGYIVGARKDACNRFHSIFWDQEKRIKDLPCERLWDINNYNNMLGSESNQKVEPPFTWHLKGGMSIISDDCRFGKPLGICYFFNPTMAADNTVYGNFIAPKNGKPHIYSYMWNSEDTIFTPFDLQGMEISAVSRCHLLVGSKCNEAMISRNHRRPIKLKPLVYSGGFGWKLINATDINDKGQIVGYGCYLGRTRIFLLDPISLKKSKV